MGLGVGVEVGKGWRATRGKGKMESESREGIEN
jgi:hypothetical protein